MEDSILDDRLNALFTHLSREDDAAISLLLDDRTFDEKEIVDGCELLVNFNSIKGCSAEGTEGSRGTLPSMNGKADASRWQEVVLGTKAAPAIDMDATAVPATSRVAVEN